jgi:hypothetical protein
VIVGHGGQIDGQMTLVMVLQHSVEYKKGQAVAMTTIHTTLLATILFQHSLWRMKGQAMAMTIFHTTPLATFLLQLLA